MKRSKRMEVVLTLALRKEQEAGEQLREYQSLYQQECDQLIELEGYDAHYLNTYGEAQNSLQAEQMIRYSELIVRLRETLVQQRGKIEGMGKNLHQLRLYWRKLHQKKQAINNMITRFATEEALEMDNLLQKELDDLARNNPKW